MKKYETVVFDLDGTLLNTLEDLADATNYALRTMQMPERTIGDVYKRQKDYWLAPSKANLNGYTLEISPAPMYYVYMAFLLAEIMTTIGIIISSSCSQRSMPNKGKIHFLMIAAMLSPCLLYTSRCV